MCLVVLFEAFDRSASAIAAGLVAVVNHHPLPLSPVLALLLQHRPTTLPLPPLTHAPSPTVVTTHNNSRLVTTHNNSTWNEGKGGELGWDKVKKWLMERLPDVCLAPPSSSPSLLVLPYHHLHHCNQKYTMKQRRGDCAGSAGDGRREG